MRLYTTKTSLEAMAVIEDAFAGALKDNLEKVFLPEAMDRIIAENIVAKEAVPAFDRSTVDGYGVRAKDTFGASQGIPAFLDFGGEVLMGNQASELPKNTAIYVPTGGMLPKGADAVVMIEDTQQLEDLVNIYKQVAPKDNIIFRGEDIASGAMIIPRGKRLKSADIGVLASLGYGQVAVYKRPKVAIISTGDELVAWNTKELPTGKIRDCNAPAVMALVQKFGGEAVYGGITLDDYETLKAKAIELLAANDMLVLSGGSSVGMRDFTTRLLKELADDKLLIEGLSIQPGKPTLLASYHGKAILGLPGHPVSALNIFANFGRQIIKNLAGEVEEPQKPTIKGILSQNVASQPGRRDMIRVKVQPGEGDLAGQTVVTPILGKSGLLKTLRDAQGVVVITEAQEGLAAGSLVEVEILE